MVLYNPCMKQIYFASITKKLKVYDIFCKEQIVEELARYVIVLPICVPLIATSKIHYFPFFNWILLKLH